MRPYHIATLHDLQRLAGMAPTQHPGFLVTRLEDLPPLPADYPTEMSYGFYHIGLKRNLNGYVRYGRQRYDFQEGVMGFCAPHQVIGYQSDLPLGASGWLLFFQTEFLAGHPVAEQVERCPYFQYQTHEALHLSKAEEESLEAIFENIQQEYQRAIDAHSRAIVLSNLELLLTYVERFYSRQFLTRQSLGSDLLTRFEQLLHQYFQQDDLLRQGLPSVGYFAQQLHVSSNYLSDLLRTLTGRSTQEHIHLQLLEKAKNYLSGTDWSVAEIAYALGFEYPSYFSKLFKTKTGCSPTVYRAQQQAN